MRPNNQVVRPAACGRSHTNDGLGAALGLAARTRCANPALAGNTDDGDWNKWTNKLNRHGTDCTGFFSRRSARLTGYAEGGK